MATIVRKHLSAASEWGVSGVVERWQAIAREAQDWLEASGVAVRDAVVLVPFVQLLAPTRQAFAAQSGWLPRIETTRTLTASLGPPGEPPVPPAPTFDLAVDHLIAQRMLARQAWGARWQRRDARGFDRAALGLVRAAHELAAAAGRVDPAARDIWWAKARDVLAHGNGPGGRERGLGQAALAWAELAASPDSDRLFACAAAAWVAVEAGPADPLIGNLFAASPSPGLMIDVNPAADAPFAGVAGMPALSVRDSFEDEAQAACAQVLEHLRADQRPVALIAQDRVLVRRVRALLERSGVALLDETGWKLSTTRAAARVMTLLLAARHDAGADHFFEWLKSGTRWPATAADGVAALEAASRRQAAWRVAAIATLPLDDPAAERVRTEALAVLAPLQSTSKATLAQWLALSLAALEQSGAMADLRADAAGQQMLAAMTGDRGDGSGSRGPNPVDAVADAVLSLADFTQWIDAVLTNANFVPGRAALAGDDSEAAPSPGEAAVDVVVTPLARTVMRPFAAAVLPGADHLHLGGVQAVDSLLPRAARALLGLSMPHDRMSADLTALAHLLALPELTLLRRRDDAGEPLGDSVPVQRLALAAAGRGMALRPWRDPRVSLEHEAVPIVRARVAAPALVPSRLSASSFEALRACPYRFFARHMLRLGEDAELDGDFEKRDYGLWLHRVLHVFHEARLADGDGQGDGGDAAADEARLHAAARAVLDVQRFDAAEFLPWSAGFEALVPSYVAWLRDREADGTHWQAGEVDMRRRPETLGGVELHGIVDRIDSVAGGGLELIDYKTGNVDKLRKQARQRFEDTQLAFYAALVGEGETRPLSAAYLALEARPGPLEIEHGDVAVSAMALVQGMVVDLSRLRQGGELVALGEGSACDYCAARGLCRRDHWSPEAVADAAGTAPADGP